MENLLILLPTALYLIYIIILLGKIYYSGESNTAKKFISSNKDFGILIIVTTVFATMIGPGYSYGAINKFYEFGFLYTIFYLMAILQIWIFGQFFAGKIKDLSNNADTIGDLIYDAYGKTAKIITGLLTFIFSIAIVALIGSAGGKIISSIFDIPLNLSITIIVIFITLYSMYGGIAAVVKTDKIQFVLIGLFLIIGIVAALTQFKENNTSATEILGYLWPDKANQMPFKEFIAIAIAFFFGELFIPVYSIRGIISKDKDTAKSGFKKAAYIGGIWFLLLTVIGISINYISTGSTDTNLFYIDLIKATFNGVFGKIIIGIGIAGMLSVVMSTMDSILHAGGSSFSNDVISSIFKKINDNEKLVYTRFAIIIISIIGLIVTIFYNDIVGILLWAYNLWVPTIVFPLGYYLVRGVVKNKLSGLIGILMGFTSWLIFDIILNLDFPVIIISISFNVISFMIVERFTNRNVNKI